VTDREEVFYRLARALDHSREASETQYAADEAHDTPENAAKAHWDAAGLLEGVITRLRTMHDEHVFAAKRMDRAQRIEVATGREYRGGDAA
jgi:hypothetical protein